MQSGQRQLEPPSTWRWSGLSYGSWDTAVGVGCRLAAWRAWLRAGRGCYVFIILIFLKTKESCFVIHKMQNILRKPLWARLHFFPTTTIVKLLITATQLVSCLWYNVWRKKPDNFNFLIFGEISNFPFIPSDLSTFYFDLNLGSRCFHLSWLWILNQSAWCFCKVQMAHAWCLVGHEMGLSSALPF